MPLLFPLRDDIILCRRSARFTLHFLFSLPCSRALQALSCSNTTEAKQNQNLSFALRFPFFAGRISCSLRPRRRHRPARGCFCSLSACNMFWELRFVRIEAFSKHTEGVKRVQIGTSLTIHETKRISTADGHTNRKCAAFGSREPSMKVISSDEQKWRRSIVVIKFSSAMKNFRVLFQCFHIFPQFQYQSYLSLLFPRP